MYFLINKKWKCTKKPYSPLRYKSLTICSAHLQIPCSKISQILRYISPKNIEELFRIETWFLMWVKFRNFAKTEVACAPLLSSLLNNVKREMFENTYMLTLVIRYSTCRIKPNCRLVPRHTHSSNNDTLCSIHARKMMAFEPGLEDLPVYDDNNYAQSTYNRSSHSFTKVRILSMRVLFMIRPLIKGPNFW